MKIIVTGCGKIGVAIIDSLVKEGHDVIAIDNRLEAIEEMTLCVSVQTAQISTH